LINVAILGFGTVGSGVYEVLKSNAANIARRAGQPVEVKYILDIRDFSARPDAALFVNQIDPILKDDQVSTVVETIGGTKPAYFYVKAALEAGKNVCTSNKELVATHGAELLALAVQKGVCFLFEASVGGGTPVITPIHQCLTANTISEVYGIVNGTTNFMLTKMEQEGMTFDEALKVAQGLGYAETIDPSADVDGIDACRKIAILASMIFGSEVHPENIPTSGIRGITIDDIYFTKKMKLAVKLIAYAKKDEKTGFSCGVEAMVLPAESMMADVADVYNAVLIRGDLLGDVLFYGKGAGKLPTASAVVADIVDAEKSGPTVHDSLFWQPTPPLKEKIVNRNQYTYYVRVNNEDTETLREDLDGVVLTLQKHNQTAVLTTPMTEKEMKKRKEKLEKDGIHVALCLKMLEV